MARRGWILFWLALVLGASAGPRDGQVVAIVVEVKGVAVMKEPDSPPSRLGTQLKLLQPVPDGRTLVLEKGGKLVLSFAGSARRVALTGPVEVVVNSSTAALKSGPQSNVLEIPIKGRQAVLAPKDKVDFSRMGGVSARATGNVRTDLARPLLALDVVRGEGSNFTIAPGEVKSVVYLMLDNPDPTAIQSEQPWTPGNVTGVAGDRVVPDWDLPPGKACFVQLETRKPEWDSALQHYKRTDYWIYRYPTQTLEQLQVCAQVADEPGQDLVVRQLQLSDVYRNYHLFDRAIERVGKLVKTDQSGEVKSLLQQLKSEKLEAERSVGG